MRKRKTEELHTSQVKWIPGTPLDWNEKKGKYLFKKMERAVRDQDDIVTVFRDGVVTLRKNRRTEGFTNSAKEIGYQGIRKGDLVIHEMDGFAGAIGISDSDGKSTPVYTVLNPRNNDEVENRYYSYLLRNMALTGYIESLAKGIRQRSTDFRYNDFGEEVYPVPPKSEQKAIATFLDRKTQAIDQLIEKKQQLIEKLKEKRQALITKAVTKGLNPDAPMKDSEIEWLGEIPAHWDVAKLGYFSTISRGAGYQYLNETESLSEENKEKVIRISDFEEFDPIWCIYDPQFENYRISKNDILIGGTGHYFGRTYFVTDRMEGLIHSYNILNIRVIKYHSKFFFYFLNSNFVRSEMDVSKLGAGQPFLDIDGINKLSVAIPSLEEQIKISNYLDKATNKMDDLMNQTEKTISKLKEYRQSLISAAVTGKIDLRDEVEATANETIAS